MAYRVRANIKSLTQNARKTGFRSRSVKSVQRYDNTTQPKHEGSGDMQKENNMKFYGFMYEEDFIAMTQGLGEDVKSDSEEEWPVVPLAKC